MTNTRLIKLDEGIGLLYEYLENFSSPEGNPQHKYEYKVLTQCLAILHNELEKLNDL